MFRTTIVLAWTILATMFFGISSILASFLDKTGNIAHRVARIWAASILRVSGIRVKLNGLKNIDPSKSYIYMANHQSNFDIPVLLAHLPVQFRWLAKAELFKIPLFGLAMKRVGYISIDRSDFRSAVKSLKKAAETIRKGTSVVIFPEGTRSLDGKIHDFKKGGFIMAIDSRFPLFLLSYTVLGQSCQKQPFAYGPITMFWLKSKSQYRLRTSPEKEKTYSWRMCENQFANPLINKNRGHMMLKIIPLGGLGEIGLNMMVFEYGESLLVVDAGLMFPEDYMLGIDYVIPDMGYLKKNRSKLVGIVLTHAHEDHIGAIPYLLREINIPVYGTSFTLGMVRHKLEEHDLLANARLIEIDPKI
jgi:1-acyl-sn-glycerol-3-phosphate acyltransferase